MLRRCKPSCSVRACSVVQIAQYLQGENRKQKRARRAPRAFLFILHEAEAAIRRNLVYNSARVTVSKV